MSARYTHLSKAHVSSEMNAVRSRTYSHALDNSSSLEDSVANGYGTNYVPGFENRNYGNSIYDARQRLVALYNYEVPLPMAMHENEAMRAVFGGWHFSAMGPGYALALYPCERIQFASA